MRQRVHQFRLWATLCLVAALLVACAKPSDPEPPKPKYEGELLLWVSTGLFGYPAAAQLGPAWFSQQATQWARDGVTVKVEAFATPQELEQALREVGEGQRTAPDIAFGRPLPEVASLLATGLAPQSQSIPGVKAMTQGVLPAVVEVQLLALNAKAFADAGTALPTNQWSEAEFESVLGALKEKGVAGLGFYHLPGYVEWFPFADGIFKADGSLAPGAESGLTKLQEYRRQGWLHPDTGKLGAEETWQQFAQGEFAVMPVGAWALPLLRAEPYNMELGAALFPGGVTIGSAYGYSVFAHPAEQQLRQSAAIDLAYFLAIPERQAELSRMTGLMPAAASVNNPFEGDPLLTQAFRAVAGFRMLPMDRVWERVDVSQTLRYALLGARAPKVQLEELQLLLK